MQLVIQKVIMMSLKKRLVCQCFNKFFFIGLVYVFMLLKGQADQDGTFMRHGQKLGDGFEIKCFFIVDFFDSQYENNSVTLVDL